MFTGIIEAQGKVKQIQPVNGDLRLSIESNTLDFSDVKLGDSIATNGICLTVIDQGSNWYTADVSGETVRHTTVSNWKNGQEVNLEKAMLPTTRFGGHIVSGHVDGVGTIAKIEKDARSLVVEMTVPQNLKRYIAHKGSITVDGISLTVNALTQRGLLLNLVPHTAAQTNINQWKTGQQINLEVDVLARYLERLLNADIADTPKSGVTIDLLAKSGFLK